MKYKQYTYKNHNGEEQERIRTHRYERDAAQMKTIINGVILPDELYVQDGESVSAMTINPMEVLYAGPMSDNWGFFFVESLSRLWPIVENGLTCKIAIPVQRSESDIWGTHTNRMKELLGWLSLREENLVLITKPTRFKSVIVPEDTFHHLEIPTYGHKTPFAYAERVGNNDDFIFRQQYAAIYDAIAAHCDVDVPGYEKIYLSRTRLKQNKEIGELYFEECFKANGFAIVYPEQLSISEQIGYMKHCKELASIEGTLAHNVLFTTRCERQIILRKQSEIIPRQSMINQAKNVPIQYVDVYYEPIKSFPLSHSKGPFWIRVNENWMEFVKDEGWKVNKPKKMYTIICAIQYYYRCIVAYGQYLVKKVHVK